MIKAMNFQTWR